MYESVKHLEMSLQKISINEELERKREERKALTPHTHTLYKAFKSPMKKVSRTWDHRDSVLHSTIRVLQLLFFSWSL